MRVQLCKCVRVGVGNGNTLPPHGACLFAFCSLIKFVEKTPEPLAADAQKDNLWTSAPKQDVGCACIIS